MPRKGVRHSDRVTGPPPDWRASVAPRPRQPEAQPGISSPNRFAPLQHQSDSDLVDDNEHHTESLEPEQPIDSHPSPPTAPDSDLNIGDPFPNPVDIITHGEEDAGYAVELDDGHEDMHETVMTTALETGLDYMQSEEVEMTLMEANRLSHY